MPKGPVQLWSEHDYARLRDYADRGFTMREAAQCMNRTYRSVNGMAHLHGIKFHGPMGAPKGNNNRRLGELRKKLRKDIEDTDQKYGNVVYPAQPTD